MVLLYVGLELLIGDFDFFVELFGVGVEGFDGVFIFFVYVYEEVLYELIDVLVCDECGIFGRMVVGGDVDEEIVFDWLYENVIDGVVN